MNPELIAAIRKLRSMPPDADAEAFLREATGGKHGLDDAQKWIAENGSIHPLAGVGRSVIKGATSNFADEFMGTDPAVGGTINPVLGAFMKMLGTGAGKDDEFRLKDEMFSEANPKTALASEMTGAVGAGLLIPGAKAATLPMQMAKTAGLGMLETGVAAAGAKEGGVEDRLDADTFMQSLLGGGISGLLTGGIGAYRYLRDPHRAANARLRARAVQSGGMDALREKFGEFEKAGLGDITTFGDLSQPMRTEAKFAAQNSESVAMQRIKDTEGRIANTPQRFMDKTRDKFQPGLPGGDINESEVGSAIKNEYDTFRKKAYGDLEGVEVENTTLPKKMPSTPAHLEALRDLKAAEARGAIGPELDGYKAIVAATDPSNTVTPAFMTQPKVKEALAQAQKEGLIGIMPEAADFASFDKMHSFKGRITRMKEAAFRSKNTPLGNKLKEVEGMIEQHMVDNVPGYEGVAGGVRERKDMMRALAQGVEAYRTGDSRQFEHAAKLLSGSKVGPGEKHLFRVGIASELIKDLRGTQGMQTAKKIMGAAAEGSGESALRDKLLAAFGDEDTLEAYMKYASLEHELMRMKGAYTGSDTFRNLRAAESNPADVIARGLGQGMASNAPNIAKASIVRVVANKVKNAMLAGTALEVGTPLSAKGKKAIMEAMAAIEKSDPLVGAGATRVAPAIISHGISLFGQKP